MSRPTPVMALVLLGLAGCGSEPPPPPPETPAEQPGRPETRSVQAADAVGYDGKAVRKSLDHVLDQQEKRNKELEEAQDKE